jgi:hypothetical protein
VEWYGDNSELNGIWDAELPDILLFGGIAIRKEAIKQLIKIIYQIKRRYSSDPYFPLKYNFRDLKKWYESSKKMDLYHHLLKESFNWRAKIVEESLACDYKIVIACFNMFAKKADKIKNDKEVLARYCFADALQRVALLAKELCITSCDVILDWPDGNRHQVYSNEYHSAFTQGCCYNNPLNRYYSGPLIDLGFSEHLFFIRTVDCSIMQFSDIVLGATREFIDFSLGKKTEDSFGVKLTKVLIPKYRGYPHRIIGRGIVVSPTGGTLQNKLLEKMLELRGYKTG